MAASQLLPSRPRLPGLARGGSRHGWHDGSRARYGRNLRPIRGTAAEPPDPHLGHALEFVKPADGGPVMPTIAAGVRHLPAGFETRPRRGSERLVLVEGRGTARVEHPLAARDLLVVPALPAGAGVAGRDRAGALRLSRPGGAAEARAWRGRPGIAVPWHQDRNGHGEPGPRPCVAAA
ncbi:hypothetical protein ACFQY5_09115 [Paeniroseomonas aquatica]|uniref:hypothetical protein n=1 Tax=Paeniroseomonas aquatica TaxID=373043 RepID=UPI0036074CD4